MSFNWAAFVNHLSVANIGATLSDPTNDNVQLVTVLGGPIGNWKYWSDSGSDISGNLASGSSWTVPFALKLTLGGPDYATLNTRPDLAAVPAYANYLATVPVGNWDSDPAAFPGGVNTVKGISLMGNGGWGYFECFAITDVVYFEQYFETNPSAVDKTKGYPGVFYIYRLGGGDFQSENYSDIEDHRVGLFEVGANVSDSAFNGSTMRAGIWIKKVGGAYEVKRIINGSVIEQWTMAVGAGIEKVDFDLQFYYQNISVTGTQAAVYMPHYISTDGSNASTLDTTFHAVDLLNVKYAQYTKPSPSNAVPFTYDIEHMLLTDPSYGSPYVPPSLSLFDDTFDGVGNLASHLPNVGVRWTYIDGSSLASNVLDGAGNYTVPVFDTGIYNAKIHPVCAGCSDSDGVPVTSYTIQALLTDDGTPNAGSLFNYGITVHGFYSGNLRWFVFLKPDPDTHTVTGNCFAELFDTPDFTLPWLPKDNLLRVYRTPGLVSIELNGQIILDAAATPSEAHADQVQISLNNLVDDGPAHLLVSRFTISKGNPLFWTEFVKTQETFAAVTDESRLVQTTAAPTVRRPTVGTPLVVTPQPQSLVTLIDDDFNDVPGTPIEDHIPNVGTPWRTNSIGGVSVGSIDGSGYWHGNCLLFKIQNLATVGKMEAVLAIAGYDPDPGYWTLIDIGLINNPTGGAYDFRLECRPLAQGGFFGKCSYPDSSGPLFSQTLPYSGPGTYRMKLDMQLDTVYWYWNNVLIFSTPRDPASLNPDFVTVMHNLSFTTTLPTKLDRATVWLPPPPVPPAIFWTDRVNTSEVL